MLDVVEIGRQCLRDEAEAIMAMVPRLDSEFEKAVKLILNCKGKCILTGVGKSGHIARKIAATLASTGTPSFYLNPLDAFHGDLGMVSEGDVVVALSYSGNTDELLRIIPLLIKRSVSIVGITGDSNSLLAKYSTCVLNASVGSEADPLNLAPTSSTTAALAMGDALACALIKARDFKATDFASLHPGGSLGKRLLAQVKDYMVSENLPIARLNDKVSDTIIEISKTKQGIAVVIDNDEIVGVVTDGDVRRAMQSNKENFFDLQVENIMSRQPKTIYSTDKLEQAISKMKKYNIHSLVVVDEAEKYVGLIDSFACQP